MSQSAVSMSVQYPACLCLLMISERLSVSQQSCTLVCLFGLISSANATNIERGEIAHQLMDCGRLSDSQQKKKDAPRWQQSHYTPKHRPVFFSVTESHKIWTLISSFVALNRRSGFCAALHDFGLYTTDKVVRIIVC